MDIICKNGGFSSEKVEFYKLNGVVTPKQDSFYTIRKVVNHRQLGIGFLLNEILNPNVLIKGQLGGSAYMEPDWDYKRFCKIDGSEFTETDIKELKKIKQEI